MNYLLIRLLHAFRVHPFVVTSFALTAALAGVNYVLWQQHAHVAERHAEALRNGEFMVHAINGRSKIEADLATLSVGSRHLEENLVDERSMEVNLGYFYRFERMTRTHLVHLDQLAAPLPPPKARFKVVPFSLQLAGSYVGCMNFLRALENGPRIVRIRNGNIERAGETNNELLLTLSLDALATP